MSKENMTPGIYDRANKLYTIGLRQIGLYMKLLGTDMVVLRPKDNSKWKNVFGGSYSSNGTLENDYQEFTTRLLINQNEMKDVWNRNRDTIETITPDGNLQIGDELQYTRNGRTFKFKILGKHSYSEDAGILYSYTLTSLIETLDE